VICNIKEMQFIKIKSDTRRFPKHTSLAIQPVTVTRRQNLIFR